VRAELRGLPKELEEIVAAHLVAAGSLIDEDPELAHRHAEAARRRAARLPIVREAAAETAYAAGLYDVALSEFRALRRMTGVSDYLPVMADCERALGRPQNALKLARESASVDLEPALRTEMTIVAAGARSDLGQHAEALRMLQQAVSGPPPTRSGPPPTRGAAAEAKEEERQAQARLRYAYADALLVDGSAEEARRWFSAAAALDPDQRTDASQRLDELDGLRIDLDESDFDETDQDGSDGDGPEPEPHRDEAPPGPDPATQVQD
jgi:tetratricopeptide (TPR) repeat protein